MSKKLIAIVTSIALITAALVSCGSSPKATKASTIIGKEGVPQPEWVNKMPKNPDIYYAVGYGKMSNKSNSIMRAEADAKDQIARWITTSVKNALTNYTNDSGSDTNRQVLDSMESISKQVSDQSLVGVERDEVWVDQEGAVYVLCSFPKGNIGKSFDEVAQSFERNEAAAFADFKREEALKFLDQETSKE